MAAILLTSPLATALETALLKASEVNPDRFMFELRMPTPAEVEVRRSLVFNPDFHDVDELLQPMLTAADDAGD